jgi:hypothetical protein
MRGLTIDPVSQDIYVAIVTTNLSTGAPGEIDRFNSDLSADMTFAKGGGYYSGVALDPITHAIYAAQIELEGPLGPVGTTKLDRFSPSGVPAGSFALAFTDSLPPIVTDSTGNIFFPNVNTHSVQVFNSAGTLLEEIKCSGCPGGSFGKPASVALNSADDLYVADVNPDRVVKLSSSGGSYSFASVMQSGRGAGAVAVDPATGDLLVGDFPDGKDFHIVAYDSSGTQFDDFAADIFPDSVTGYGALSTYHMAVNATTHKLYVGEFEKFYVFEKVPISLPATTIEPATLIGQLTATLNSTVNANRHATLECEFEYTDEADFLANGFTNATSLPCSELPDGSDDTTIYGEASGLTPDTAYRYRVTAVNNGGSVSSGSETFETLPAIPPTTTTQPPQGVGPNVAILKGEVNPHGGSVSDCHFEFGTSLAYGTSVSCSMLPGPVTTDVGQARKISGLAPNATYHYRLVVTTNAGTDQGDDVEFTTPNPPPEPEPEIPPPLPADPPVVAPPPVSSGGPIEEPQPPCRKGFRRQARGGQTRCVKICRRGFRRSLVQGKVRCVKRVRSNRHRRSGH